jgi:glycolate oxidase
MTSLQMPKVDKSILSSKDKISLDLGKILKSENILSHEDEVRPYETDALAAYKQKPLLVVLPETVEQVSEILKYCNKNKIKVVPRGAGTGLSGGALPLADCVLLSMGKFNKILEIDYQNKCIVTQPCVLI